MTTIKVDMADYEDAVRHNTGWCRYCEDFTRECTEPDAEGYDCEECDTNSVVGAEQALLIGCIDPE